MLPGRGVSVDAHLHLWDRARFRYPWMDATALPDRFDLEELSALPPRRVVVVEADCLPDQSLDEVRWIDGLAARAPSIAGIVARAAIEDGDAVEGELDVLAGIPRVVGVRRVLQAETTEWLERPGLVRGLRAVARAGLVFDACVRWDQLPALIRLRHGVPEPVIVIDHLGKPPIRDGLSSSAAAAWRAAIRELAEEPRTVVKVSGLPAEAASGPLERQVDPYIRFALEVFGPSRAMAGSDWPVSRTESAHDYARWFAHLATAFGLTESERDDLLWRTAERTYSLDDRAPAGEGGIA